VDLHLVPNVHVTKGSLRDWERKGAKLCFAEGVETEFPFMRSQIACPATAGEFGSEAIREKREK
jgi:hypothetical protein